MIQLSRQQVIDQLRAALANEITQDQLAAWAFDQFYAIEEDRAEIEPDYRRVIAAVLDDLMFADQPGMALSTYDLENAIGRIEAAQSAEDDEDENEEDDDDEDDDDRV